MGVLVGVCDEGVVVVDAVGGVCVAEGDGHFLGARGGEDVSRFGVWGLRVEIGGLRFCDRGLVGGCRQAMIDRPLPPQARAETVLVLCLA